MAERIVAIPYEPRTGQIEMHRNIETHRFSVIVAHRRFGKTVAVINHLIRQAAQCTKLRPRYGYVAPLYSQAKSIAWDYLRHYTAPIPDVKRNESELWVELPNTARIRLFGADNPDALRGMYFDGVVLDEVAQMKPGVWEEVIRPALSDREGFAVFIGTPKGINQFHKLYQDAIKDPVWYAGMFTADRTGILPEEELQSARRTMSDNLYRQEMLCDFSASSEDVLISLDVVQAATSRVYHESVYAHAPLIMGVDVARFGDDSSVIIYRKGIVAYGLTKIKDYDTMRLADLVAGKITHDKPDAVFLDEVGIGAGVLDRLRQLGFRVTAVNGGSKAEDDNKYMNKRAEMWVKMRDWMLDGGLIPDDLELKSDLVSLRYTYDNRQRYVLERKEDSKKRGQPSPDCADALAMTWAYPVHVLSDYQRAVGSDIRTVQDSPLYWR